MRIGVGRHEESFFTSFGMTMVSIGMTRSCLQPPSGCGIRRSAGRPCPAVAGRFAPIRTQRSCTTTGGWPIKGGGTAGHGARVVGRSVTGRSLRAYEAATGWMPLIHSPVSGFGKPPSTRFRFAHQLTGIFHALSADGQSDQ